MSNNGNTYVGMPCGDMIASLGALKCSKELTVSINAANARRAEGESMNVIVFPSITVDPSIDSVLVVPDQLRRKRLK
jgi:hypothetical protein